MSTEWIDISSTNYYGDYTGYIRYANKVLNISGTADASTSTNVIRVFSITPNTHYRVTMVMQNRFRLACTANLATGQTVTNYVISPLDENGSTNYGTSQTLEITSEADQVYLVVGVWSTGAGDTIANTLATIVAEEDHTTHTVVFKDWDGPVLKTTTVAGGTSAVPPTNPSRDGYTFTGWNGSYENVTADITLTAQYRQIGTYLVTFTDYDGTVLKTEYVTEGYSATAPTAPSREEYDFSGWSAPFDSIIADITITAVYTPKVYHTVSFIDWNNSVLKAERVEHGQMATAPDSPIRGGYRFIGWDGTWTTAISDLYIHALYEQIVICAVSFTDWNGTVLKAEQLEQGYVATPPSNPSRSGYTFIGWEPSVLTAVTANIVFTAKYEKINVYYTVNFFDDNNVLLMSSEVLEGETAIPPLPPVKADCYFDRWDTDFSSVTSNLTVTAVFRAAQTRTAILIYRSNGTLLQAIDRVLSANLRESLDGELTLSFSILADRGEYITPNCVARFDGNYFNIVRVTKAVSSGSVTISATCEHISYLLNDKRYEIDSFDLAGTPTELLSAVLSGTQFSAGTVEINDNIEMKINRKVSRREALMQLVALCGGELEYDGHFINIREHRGSVEVKPLMNGKNVTDVSVTYDSRSETESYDISFYKAADFVVGDEVEIKFAPMHLNTRTRIIAVEYNPFYRYSFRVEVGSYTPTLNDSLYKIEKNVLDTTDGVKNVLSAVDDLSENCQTLESKCDNVISACKEVRNLVVGESAFTVIYADSTMATYNFSTDSDGRIKSITKAV